MSRRLNPTDQIVHPRYNHRCMSPAYPASTSGTNTRNAAAKHTRLATATARIPSHVSAPLHHTSASNGDTMKNGNGNPLSPYPARPAR